MTNSKYYDLLTDPYANILPSSIRELLPTPEELHGQPEAGLMVWARLAIWEFGPDSETDKFRDWHGVPNWQNLVIAGELIEGRFYARSFSLVRVGADLMTLRVNREARSSESYDELTGRSLPFCRDLDWVPRTFGQILGEYEAQGFAIWDEQLPGHEDDA